jgi:hypothetical protein
MIVTFDFDDTLLYRTLEFDEDGDAVFPHRPVGDGRNPMGFYHLMEHLEASDEVHLVTSRMRNRLPEVEEWLRKWGVRDRFAGVHATNGQWKVSKLVELGSEVHYDDDKEELGRLPQSIRGQYIPPHPSWLAGGID